jgi:hypothetical protein
MEFSGATSNGTATAGVINATGPAAESFHAATIC